MNKRKYDMKEAERRKEEEGKKERKKERKERKKGKDKEIKLINYNNKIK